MASIDQLNANRENSQLSTGPITEEGKRRSALNSARHGFTGQVVVLTPEEIEPYNQFSEDFLKQLSPVGAHERQLAYILIDSRWRMNQIAVLESAIYALGHRENIAQFSEETPQLAAALARALTFTQRQRELDRLHRYEGRLNRQALQAQAKLQELHETRIRQEQEDFQDAAVLLNQAREQGKRFNPADFGFVWSNQEITGRLNRILRIKDAWAYNSYANVTNPLMQD